MDAKASAFMPRNLEAQSTHDRPPALQHVSDRRGASAARGQRCNAAERLLTRQHRDYGRRMTQRTAFEMRNKTGSDVFIAASTMAG